MVKNKDQRKPIQLQGELLEEFQVVIKNYNDKVNESTRLQKELELVSSERNTEKLRMWKAFEERFPQTTEGAWSWDTKTNTIFPVKDDGNPFAKFGLPPLPPGIGFLNQLISAASQEEDENQEQELANDEDSHS
jgi:hypothetical protein